MQLKFTRGINFRVCTCTHIEVQLYETEERVVFFKEELKKKSDKNIDTFFSIKFD